MGAGEGVRTEESSILGGFAKGHRAMGSLGWPKEKTHQEGNKKKRREREEGLLRKERNRNPKSAKNNAQTRRGLNNLSPEMIEKKKTDSTD